MIHGGCYNQISLHSRLHQEKRTSLMIRIQLAEFAASLASGSISEPSIVLVTSGERAGLILFGLAGNSILITTSARKTFRLWRKVETLVADLQNSLGSDQIKHLTLYDSLARSPLSPLQDAIASELALH